MSLVRSLHHVSLSLACTSTTRRCLSSVGGGGIRITVYPSGHDSSGDNSRRNRNKNKRRPNGSSNNKQGGGSNNNKASSRHRKQRGQSSYKFVDRARIRVTGGAGGSGSLSNQHLGRYKRRPDGGHGGDGGSVILVADGNEQTLGMSMHHHAAEDGGAGGSRAMRGRNGRNRIVRVPCGVIVRRVLGYDEVWDEEECVVRKIVSEEREDYEDEWFDTATESGSLENGHGDYHDENYASAEQDNDETESYIDYDNQSSDSDAEDSFGDDSDHDVPSMDNQYSVGTEEQDDVDDIDLVNTGIKASDGMYHWRPESSDQDEQDEWVSSSTNMYNYEREKVVVADLDKPGSFVVIASGGRGGTGSSAYAKKQWTSSLMTNAAERRVGQRGETVHLELELKLIADLGLVGFPNAGKSSLLSAMSMARPEIAPYPFTTLHPLVGSIRYRDGFRVIAADVPGLIGGAAEGRGRGHDFLRHLERTKSLLYIVDAAGVDGRDPIEDLHVLAEEIGSYGDGDMMSRPALLVANKMDLIPEDQERESLLFDLAVAAEETGIDYRGDVLGISAGVTGEGLGLLSKAMRKVVTEGEANRIISEAASS